MNTLRVLRTARVASRTVQRSSFSPSLSRSLSTRLTPARSTRPIFSQLSTSTGSSLRAFSGSSRVFGTGKSDAALLDVLEQEIQHEKQAAESSPAVPEFLEEFNKAKIWKVEEHPGKDEVSLTRTFGNEQVRVMFSISDVEEAEPSFDESDGEGNEEEVTGLYPIRTAISISKPNGGIAIEALAQDGLFSIVSVSFFKDAKLATDLSSESDWKRRSLYGGPNFDHLDITVQEAIEAFLAERGVNESLALFIPEYAEYKEQKEYESWLHHVKDFVAA